MTQSIEKSFFIDPLTTNNVIYCDSLTLRYELTEDDMLVPATVSKDLIPDDFSVPCSL